MGIILKDKNDNYLENISIQFDVHEIKACSLHASRLGNR